jgi:hypothetical protein
MKLGLREVLYFEIEIPRSTKYGFGSACTLQMLSN